MNWFFFSWLTFFFLPHSGLGDMERLIRLQHENETLKAQLSGNSDEQVQHFKELLEEAQKRKEKLELENRQQGLKIVQLESELQSKRLEEAGRRGENQWQSLVEPSHLFCD